MLKCRQFYLKKKKSLKSRYIRKPATSSYPPTSSFLLFPAQWLQDLCVTTWEIQPIRYPNDFNSGVVISWVMKKKSKSLKLFFLSGWFPHLIQSTPLDSFPKHIPRKLIRVAIWPKECEAQKHYGILRSGRWSISLCASCAKVFALLVFLTCVKFKEHRAQCHLHSGHHKKPASQKDYWLVSRLPESFLWDLLSYSPLIQKGKLNFTKGEWTAQNMHCLQQRQSSRES